MTRPQLFTFDVFGTLLDWRRGLHEGLLPRGLQDGEFDRVIDRQAELEGGKHFTPYARIFAQSLVDVLRTNALVAAGIGVNVGRFPAYPEAPAALAKLQQIAPCVAITNSDREHGMQARATLGLREQDWYCAEDLKAYKPDPKCWHEVARLRGVSLGPHWWHVSAYGDYDLSVAKSLGLTTVYVARPHRRPGPHDLEVRDLADLVAQL